MLKYSITAFKAINMKRFFVFVFLVLITLFSSEALYFFTNQPERVAGIFLRLAQSYIKKGKLDQAVKKLNTATSFYLKINSTIYKNTIPAILLGKNTFAGLDEKTRSGALDLLKTYLPKIKKEKATIMVSNIYYNLALVAYSGGYPDLADNLFKTSTFLDPEFSFLFIEWADLAFNKGNFEKGKEILNTCLKFNPPRAHCNEYLEKNVTEKSFSPVGSFK